MNQALHGISLELQKARDAAVLEQLPSDESGPDGLGLRSFVHGRPFGLMVQDLAKPGQDILDTLTPEKYCLLLKALGVVVGASNKLDKVKKLVIYNKAQELTDFVLLDQASTDDLTAEKAHLLHMAVGAVGETGELGDAIGAYVNGDVAELDVTNVLEEVGDTLFYLQGILNTIGYSFHDAMLANKVKLLGKRYKGGYSDAAAQARADKPAGE